MKGHRTIKVNGKDIPLVFNWGAVEDFCEEEGITVADFEQVVRSPKKMRSLIYHMAREAGAKIKKDDLRAMPFSALAVVTGLIKEAMAGNEQAEVDQ